MIIAQRAKVEHQGAEERKTGMNAKNTETLQWECHPFDQLSGALLYSWLQLREQVFNFEQHCTVPDMDGRDSDALHLLALDGEQVIAGARVFPPDSGDDKAVHIGRVVVTSGWRGCQLGRKLMLRALELCAQRFPQSEVVLAGQAHLCGFYESLGFEVISEIYEEAGIPHLDMRLKRDL